MKFKLNLNSLVLAQSQNLKACFLKVNEGPFFVIIWREGRLFMNVPRRSLKALSSRIQNSSVCKNYRPQRFSFSLSVANGAPSSLSEGLGRNGRREGECALSLENGALCPAHSISRLRLQLWTALGMHSTELGQRPPLSTEAPRPEESDLPAAPPPRVLCVFLSFLIYLSTTERIIPKA